MISAVYDRRSIKKFLDTPISKEDIEAIIQSGIKAPSSKNRQPWKFTVVQGRAKEEMLSAFRRGILREEHDYTLLQQSKQHIAGAKYTVDIIAEAPVIVFVSHLLGKSILEDLTTEERIAEICNIQSIGAAIENMVLAATDRGIGSLWICDIYFAYPELCEWLHSGGQLVAAVALGYPDEFPRARTRKGLEEVVEWRL